MTFPLYLQNIDNQFWPPKPLRGGRVDPTQYLAPHHIDLCFVFAERRNTYCCPGSSKPTFGIWTQNVSFEAERQKNKKRKRKKGKKAKDKKDKKTKRQKVKKTKRQKNLVTSGQFSHYCDI